MAVKGDMWISNYTTDNKFANIIESLVEGSETCKEAEQRLEASGLTRVPVFGNERGEYYVDENLFVEVYYFRAMHQVSVCIKENKSGRNAQQFADLDNSKRKLAAMSTYEIVTY